MKVPTGRAEVETVIKRSRFLAIAEPVASQEEARALLKALKSRYTDANHVCHAFSVGHGNAVTQGCSDDGEPSGTAGRPMLEVLKGSGVTNVLVAVVRTFGGIKLGTGGLVQAYGGAAKDVLDALPVAEDVPVARVRATVDYPSLVPLRRKVEGLGGKVVGERFEVGVTLEIELPAEHVADLRAWHAEVTRGGAGWEGA